MSYALVIPRPRARRRGVGALSPQSATIAAQAASAASLTGVLIGALAAIPIAGPIAAAVAGVGILLANVFAGCGDTCVEATKLANEAEPLLLQNLQTYLSAPTRYASFQAAALNNYDLTWNALVSGCSNPQLGAAGQACISDRQRGACHYQTSPGGWDADGTYTYPGAAGSGSACWNWFVGYRDPIANDPNVVPDPVPGSSVVSGLLSDVGISSSATLFGLPVGDVVIGALLLALAGAFL